MITYLTERQKNCTTTSCSIRCLPESLFVIKNSDNELLKDRMQFKGVDESISSRVFIVELRQELRLVLRRIIHWIRAFFHRLSLISFNNTIPSDGVDRDTERESGHCLKCLSWPLEHFKQVSRFISSVPIHPLLTVR